MAKKLTTLADVPFRENVRDTITLCVGKVTAKLERASGFNSVCIEGMDTTGRAFTDWVDLDRAELVGTESSKLNK